MRGHTAGVFGVAFSANAGLLASGSDDGTVKLWDTSSFSLMRTLRPDRRYERADITGLTGVTEAQRTVLLALAPDAPVRGAGGQRTRLFELFQGPDWTLLGYETDRRSVIAPRAGLRIHVFGRRGDIIDDGGHMRDAYGPSPGDWVLVRPDGYVGAVVSGAEVSALEPYLARVGVP